VLNIAVLVLIGISDFGQGGRSRLQDPYSEDAVTSDS